MVVRAIRLGGSKNYLESWVVKLGWSELDWIAEAVDLGDELFENGP
jgi:hypothetical protein